MAEDERTGGNSGIYAMLIIVVILILAVALYFSGMFDNGGAQDTNIDVDIETPSLPEPSVPDGDGSGGTGQDNR